MADNVVQLNPQDAVPAPPAPNPVTKTDNGIRLILVLLSFISFDGFVYLMYTKPNALPETRLDMILTAFLLWIGGLVGYYFGSSSGSAAKNHSLGA